MIGFPNDKVYLSKQDFYNLLEEYPDEIKIRLGKLIDSRFIWVIDREIKEGEEYLENETHKLIQTSVDDEENEGKQRDAFMQMILVEDTNSEFYRVGWTLEEASAFLQYQKPVENGEGE